MRFVDGDAEAQTTLLTCRGHDPLRPTDPTGTPPRAFDSGLTTPDFASQSSCEAHLHGTAVRSLHGPAPQYVWTTRLAGHNGLQLRREDPVSGVGSDPAEPSHAAGTGSDDDP